MGTNKGLGIVLVIIGAVGLIYGLFMLFTGNIGDALSWVSAILGLIFFSSGIGLMKSTGSSEADPND